MRHIIIASHGRFAEGLSHTLEFIAGVRDAEVICAYVDDSPLEEQVKAVFSKISVEDEVLVLTDIMQGSVNQAFAPYMGKKVFLVAGVNVPCCLELAFAEEPLSNEAILVILDRARSAMQLMNVYQAEENDGDE